MFAISRAAGDPRCIHIWWPVAASDLVAGKQPVMSAILGWNSKEHGAPPFFLPPPSSLTNPLLTPALPVASVVQPPATQAAIRTVT